MKCWVCDGLGVTYKSRRSAFPKETCTRCNGTGEIQTNEEWFASLPTEEKAVFMTLFSLRRANVYDKTFVTNGTFYETAADSANESMELTVGTKKLKAYKELLAWLKGEHKA